LTTGLCLAPEWDDAHEGPTTANDILDSVHVEGRLVLGVADEPEARDDQTIAHRPPAKLAFRVPRGTDVYIATSRGNFRLIARIERTQHFENDLPVEFATWDVDPTLTLH
jgi:hypothetical protein